MADTTLPMLNPSGPVADGDLFITRQVGDVVDTKQTGAALKAYIGSGSPGGVDTNIQYNNSGAFGGTNNFRFDDANTVVYVENGSDQSTISTISFSVTDGTASSALSATDVTISDGTMALGRIQVLSGTATMDLYNDDATAFINMTATTGLTSIALQGASGSSTLTSDGLTVPNTGLQIEDPTATDTLTIRPASNLTAPRTLNIVTGDADRTLTLGTNNNLTTFVVGPSSSTDNAFARFDSTTGKLIQDSVATLSDTGVINTTAGTNFFVANSGGITGTLNWSALATSNKVISFPNSTGTVTLLAVAQTLQNKTLDNTNQITVLDNLFTVQDNLDPTKQVQLQLSGITTGNTRTYTAPNNSGTLALTSDLTNIKPHIIGFSTTSPATTGQQGTFSTSPQAGAITAWSIGLIGTGTCTIRVWKIATGTTAPTVANNINTSGVSISTGTYIRSTTTSDFTTTTVTANDIFGYEITAVTGSVAVFFGLEITAT